MTVSPLLSEASYTAEEQKWISCLESAEYGQSHLLQHKDNVEGTKRLLHQITLLDKTYPGGLLNYINRSKKLLEESKEGVNPFQGYTPEIPLGVNLVTGDDQFMKFEASGLEQLNRTAFVLVAGGLGERLGYPGIKLSLPCEITTGTSYIEYYMKMILACEVHVEKTVGKKPKLPLAIMTSEDTHAPTMKFLSDHQCFGFPQDQLTIMKQEKVPALLDNEAHMALKSGDSFEIETKPHGHGDVHTLLNQHGLPSKWVAEGRRWMVLFQDTNALVSHALAPMLGVSSDLDLTMNSLTIPRKPGEAVGAICKLNKADGESLTINVEYNQLVSLVGQDVAEPDTGYSKYPGNTNILVFKLDRYAEILTETGGTIPEFVNPKYKDASKTTFKSPTRLECLMQELPRLFTKADNVGSTQMDRWVCFSTVKNNVVDAAVKSKQNVPAESAFTGEAEFYYANMRLLEIAAKDKCVSVEIESPVATKYLEVESMLGARVVMTPSFGISLQQIKNRIKGGSLKISNKSTLILDGEVDLDGLELDGGLTLRATPGCKLHMKNLKISNKGPEFAPLPEDSNAVAALKIRGYDIKQMEMSVLTAKQ